MRRLRFFLALAALCAGFCLFRVKYQVMAIEKSLKETTKSIAENKEAIHVLKAELTHLNDPTRLQKLAVSHLSFSALKPTQIVAISELPKQTVDVKVAADPIEALMDAVNAVSIKTNSKTENNGATNAAA